jgi:hypothetical protein
MPDRLKGLKVKVSIYNSDKKKTTLITSASVSNNFLTVNIPSFTTYSTVIVEKA